MRIMNSIMLLLASTNGLPAITKRDTAAEATRRKLETAVGPVGAVAKMTGTFSSASVWMGRNHVVEAYPHANDPSLYIFAAHDGGATKMSAYRVTSPGAVPVWQSICAHPSERPIDASSISNTWDTAPLMNGYPLTDINVMSTYPPAIDKVTGTFSSAGAWMGRDHVVEAYPHARDPSLYIFAAHDAGATKMSAYRVTSLGRVWQSIRAHPTSLEPIDASSISNTWDSAQPSQQNGYPVVDIVVEPSLPA